MTELDEATATVAAASRALVGVIASSYAPVREKITPSQVRVLLVLTAADGPMRSGDLAERLGIHPSTFTRTADRLVEAGWIRRTVNPDNRRESLVSLTNTGSRLVNQIARRRDANIKAVLAKLTADQRRQVVLALEVFAEAAGEPSFEDLLALGM
jgi:DNA-binding MarR family transcriptional regulator